MGSLFSSGAGFGADFGGLIGGNSTLGKAIGNDPIGNALGFESGLKQGAPPTAGPYAGITPTLADANSGYTLAPTATQLAQQGAAGYGDAMAKNAIAESGSSNPWAAAAGAASPFAPAAPPPAAGTAWQPPAQNIAQMRAGAITPTAGRGGTW